MAELVIEFCCFESNLMPKQSLLVYFLGSDLLFESLLIQIVKSGRLG